jgi:hypothetical protein
VTIRDPDRAIPSFGQISMSLRNLRSDPPWNAPSVLMLFLMVPPSSTGQAILNRSFRLRQLARRQVNITAGFVGQVAAEIAPRETFFLPHYRPRTLPWAVPKALRANYESRPPPCRAHTPSLPPHRLRMRILRNTTWLFNRLIAITSIPMMRVTK